MIIESLTFGVAALASLFAIVDPFAALPVYLALTARATEPRRRVIAWRASLTTFAVLALFGGTGQVLFHFFGISIAAFKIAGGLLLGTVAFEMMNAKTSSTKSTPAEEEDAALREDIAIVPIGIPLLSGPGAIASSMMLSARAGRLPDKLALVVAMAIVAALTWLVLRSATGIARVLGRTGMNIIARVMGLILAATAAQFVIDGLRAAFPILAR
ncbi:MAG: MarC family protein [Deltaproteobacteria bacterium]